MRPNYKERPIGRCSLLDNQGRETSDGSPEGAGTGAAAAWRGFLRGVGLSGGGIAIERIFAQCSNSVWKQEQQTGPIAPWCVARELVPAVLQ